MQSTVSLLQTRKHRFLLSCWASPGWRAPLDDKNGTRTNRVFLLHLVKRSIQTTKADLVYVKLSHTLHIPLTYSEAGLSLLPASSNFWHYRIAVSATELIAHQQCNQ